jgi:Family of unknown function (DUF6580)
MKLNKSLFWIFGLLILASSLYRVWDGRPWGFTPVFAMAIFSGAVIKDKRWAFIMPILCLFLSDLLYEALYRNGLSVIKGFYSGQIGNYLLIAGLVLIGFLVKKVKLPQVLMASLAAPLVYFLASNFMVWAGGGGLARPKTFGGLIQCYADGLPFLKGYILGSVVFSALFFSVYYLVRKYKLLNSTELA